MGYRVLLAATLITVAGIGSSTSHAASMSAQATCASSTTVEFSWTFYDTPGSPVGYPQWTGYDVQRRAAGACGPWVRVNAAPYPRTADATQSFTYSETPPDLEMTYEYRAIPVDNERHEVVFSLTDCDLCYWTSRSTTSCPEFSAPIAQGTLTDWGWTLYVEPCTSSCLHAYYLEGAWPSELRNYAGTGTVVLIYGAGVCGTVEGCAVFVDHYAIGTCGATAVNRSSWGKVKSIYR